MFDVFISYRRSDGIDAAAAIARFLNSKGLRVFFDKNSMEDGQYFDIQIGSAIEEAPNYVLVASSDVLPFREGNDWVHREMSLALGLYKESDGTRSFIPVVSEGSSFGKNLPEAERYEDLVGLSRLDWLETKEIIPNEKELDKILKAVTRANRRTLWNAGHRWLESMRAPGARFANLSVVDSILPMASAKPPNFDLPVSVRDRHGDSKQLLDAITALSDNIFIIGPGGSGKTTALLKIMESAYAGPYRSDSQVPLFIELSKAPDTWGRLYENGYSSYIRRAVYQLLRSDRRSKQIGTRMVSEIDSVFNADPALAVAPVIDLFTRESPAPEYVLLLDGLNEVSLAEPASPSGAPCPPVTEMITEEIRELMRCPNVRVVLTSRIPLEGLGSDIAELYLCGVEHAGALSFLQSRGISKEEATSAMSDPSLGPVLSNPLFLTIYTSLKNRAEIVSRGTLLRAFLNERATAVGDYTAQRRLEQVGEDVACASSARALERITARMQWFLLDFILPEVAWRMVSSGAFHVEDADFADVVATVLGARGETDVCGSAGKALFTKYRGTSPRQNVAEVADSILKLGEGDMEEAAWSLIDSAVRSLGMLVWNGQGYAFPHQYFRDYLAAVRVANRLRIASELFKRNSEASIEPLAFLSGGPLDSEVSTLLGEYLGEPGNAPRIENGRWTSPCGASDPESDRSLISRVLDIYRNRYSQSFAMAIRNLVKVLTSTRFDLSGADLSNLDLTQCHLNDVRLGRPGMGSIMRGAKLSVNSLMRRGHTGPINDLCFSADSRLLATASDDCTASIWDITTNGQMAAFRHNGPVKCVSLSRDCSHLLTASEKGVVTLWNCISGATVSEQNKRFEFQAISLSPDASTYAAASKGHVYLWSTRGEDEPLVLRHGIEHLNLQYPIDVCSLAFSPDGTMLATASKDLTAGVWDVKSGNRLLRLKHDKEVHHVAFSNNSQLLVTASESIAYVWDASTGDSLASFPLQSTIADATFVNNDRVLMIVDCNCGVMTWDIHSRKMLTGYQLEGGNGKLAISRCGRHVAVESEASIRIHFLERRTRETLLSSREGTVHHVVVSQNANLVASASADNTACVWDISTDRMVMRAEHAAQVRCVAFSPDGSMLATASDDGTAGLWDLETGERLTLIKHMDKVRTVVFSPDGSMLATASDDGSSMIWDAASCHRNRQSSCASDRSPSIVWEWGVDAEGLLGFTMHAGKIGAAAFSPDNKLLATSANDGFTKLMDTGNKEKDRPAFPHDSEIVSVSFSSDGTMLASTSGLSALVWDVSSGEILLEAEHWGWVVDAFFYPISQLLVTVSDDGTARIWDIAKKEILFTLNHPQGVSVAAVSPNEGLIATASIDAAWVWDTSSYEKLIELNCASAIETMCFSPNGQMLVIGCRDGKVNVWDTATGQLLTTFRHIPGLMIGDVDMRGLASECNLTDDDKHILQLYGARL